MYYYLLDESQHRVGTVLVFFTTYDRGATWTYTRPVTGSHVNIVVSGQAALPI